MRRDPRSPLVTVALLALLSWAAPSSLTALPSTPTRAAASEQPTAAAEPVAIRGWLDAEAVYGGEEITVWIAVENHSAGDLRDLRFVDFRAPGFRQAGPCWKDNAPACLPAGRAGLAENPGLPSLLPRGSAVSVRASLTPAASSGGYSLTALLAWKDPDGAERTRTVSVGPIAVKDRASQRWAAAAQWVKDLALPVVLAWVAYAFRRREEWRSRVQSTWNLMLPKSHENAEKYYLPLLASAGSLLHNLDKWGDAESERKAFYFFLTFLRRMKQLKDEVGGFYFKDRRGEVIAGDSWRIFTLRVEGRLGKEHKDRALELMTPGESFAVFLEKLEWQPGWRETLGLPGGDGELQVFSELESRFRLWHGEPEPDDLKTNLALMRLFSVVLRYEANRPYRFWYERIEPLDSDRVRAALAETMKLLAVSDPEERGELERLRSVVEEYVKATRRGERWPRNQRG